MADFTLLLMVLVPAVSSGIVYVAGRTLGRQVGWVAFLALLFSTLLSVVAMSRVSLEGPVVEPYSWAPVLNIVFGLRADGLSVPFAATISILATVIALYSMPYMSHKIGEKKTEYGSYFALYLLYAAGMLGTVLSTNLVEFYLFYELMLIPSYFLIAQWGYGERERIAFMYFLWTHVGALALLLGIMTTYAVAGSFDIYEIPALLAAGSQPFELLRWISIAMFLGFFVKMACFGLHVWLPHAHAEAPTPISALLSPAMIGIGGYATVRITLMLFPTVFEAVSLALAIWALITMFYGGFMAFTQDDIKRLLAYSSISQMGYILFGIASMSLIGVSGSMFHYVSHGTGKGILFMAAGAIMLQTDGLRSIRRMGGLAPKMPVTATAALIGFLAIMGTPPLNGFQSEWMLFSGAITQATHPYSTVRLVIATLGLVASALTVGYGLWTIRRVFFGPRPQELEHVKEAGPLVTGPLILLAAITILLGIYPRVITDALLPTVQSLLPP